MPSMIRTPIVFIILCFLFTRDCLSNAECVPGTLAMYEVKFDTFWNRQEFYRHYPLWRPPASWSKMLGFSHNDSFEVFRKGELASPALKRFVETADASLFDLYAQGSIGVFDVFNIPPIGTGVGSAKSLMLVDGNHTKVSLVSKIMPSPDWFVGVDTQELCSGGRWSDSVHLKLGPLDAGTDKGFTFTSPNWPTDPQEKIRAVTAHHPNHPASSFYYPEYDQLPNLAQITLIKRKEYTLMDKFDAADHSLAVSDPKQRDIYRYDIDDQNVVLENPDIENLIEVSTVAHPNRATKPLKKKRRPSSTRKLSSRRRYPEHGRRLKQIRKKHRRRNGTAPRPSILEGTEPGLLLKTKHRPPYQGGVSLNRSRLVSGQRIRNRIPSGDPMAVISNIVKDYQKERRRKKIKKRRKKEKGKRREQRQHMKPPRDCRVSDWKEWSSCSKTCGIGEKTRHRKIIKHARGGGKPCPLLQETTWCGSASACPREYFNW